MDYADLLGRSWRMIWQYKFLIVLGIIAGLNNGGGNSSNSRTDAQTGTDISSQLSSMETVLIVAIVLGVLLLVLVLYYLARIAEGGLIKGVYEIEKNGSSSFRSAWSSGWKRSLKMFLLSLLLGVPVLLIVAAIVAVAVILHNEDLILPVILIGCCAILPVAIFLGLIQQLADRACMIEEKNVLESISDGWQTLRNNTGHVLVIWLVQFGISFAIILVLGAILCCFIVVLAGGASGLDENALIGFFILICCIVVPIELVVRGIMEAFFSTYWTLAWLVWRPQNMDVNPVDLDRPALA